MNRWFALLVNPCSNHDYPSFTTTNHYQPVDVGQRAVNDMPRMDHCIAPAVRGLYFGGFAAMVVEAVARFSAPWRQHSWDGASGDAELDGEYCYPG